MLGLLTGGPEAESTWSEFFRRLKERGLRGVDIVVSDDHQGLVKAVETHFQGASWQRCQTHFIRNLLDACPKALQEEFHGRLRLVFDAPDLEIAWRLKDELVREWADRAPKAAARLEEGFEDAMAVMALPASVLRRAGVLGMESRAGRRPWGGGQRCRTT